MALKGYPVKVEGEDGKDKIPKVAYEDAGWH